MSRLTEREIRVLQAVADGYKEEELATMLFYSREHIKRIKREIRLKLGAYNFSHAIALAIRKGIIQ